MLMQNAKPQILSCMQNKHVTLGMQIGLPLGGVEDYQDIPRSCKLNCKIKHVTQRCSKETYQK